MIQIIFDRQSLLSCAKFCYLDKFVSKLNHGKVCFSLYNKTESFFIVNRLYTGVAYFVSYCLVMKETFVTFIKALKSLILTFFVRTIRSFFLSSDSPSLPFLPLDLVEEILCRLPVKLLFQLRCQSKSFNTLISNPQFAIKHFSMSTMHHHHLTLIFTDRATPWSSSRVISYPLYSIFYPPYSIFPSVVKPTLLHFAMESFV